MKSKIKTKTKKISSARKPKIKHFPAHYLAFVLAIALMFEGWVFGVSTVSNWQNAVSVLDVSSQVTEISQDFALVFQPMTDAVASINKFYELAAAAMTDILDLSESGFGSEITMIMDGVSSFYEIASTQMAQLLDISGSPGLSGAVAGISIVK